MFYNYFGFNYKTEKELLKRAPQELISLFETLSCDYDFNYESFCFAVISGGVYVFEKNDTESISEWEKEKKEQLGDDWEDYCGGLLETSDGKYFFCFEN